MNVICSNMHGSRGDHIKSSKSDRERQIWHHLYVKSKKKMIQVSYWAFILKMKDMFIDWFEKQTKAF